MARRLEECEDERGTLIDIGILVSPRLWLYLGPDLDPIRVVIDDIAYRYRSHRERTPETGRLSVAHYVDRYVKRIKAGFVKDGRTPTAMWLDFVSNLEPRVRIAEPLPSGVSRRLRCFDRCCLDDSHAEMVLIVGGRVVGGTRFEPELRWTSWGPAGESPGHLTRLAAEVVQLKAGGRSK
jgi:hypothetical protein